MYSQECGKFSFCLSLDPDHEGLDSDAAKTKGSLKTILRVIQIWSDFLIYFFNSLSR